MAREVKNSEACELAVVSLRWSSTFWPGTADGICEVYAATGAIGAIGACNALPATGPAISETDAGINPVACGSGCGCAEKGAGVAAGYGRLLGIEKFCNTFSREVVPGAPVVK